MTSCCDYNDYELAVLVLDKMQRMTGDRCYLLLISQRYWKIVRYDPTGKEVQWE